MRAAVEAITNLIDAQAQARAILLKQQAAGIAAVVLVVADTRANRRALADAAPTLLPAFPVPRREVLASLLAGRIPAGNGIVRI